MVYALDKSGRILGYLLHNVLSNMGLAKRAKFYFMNVAERGYFKEAVLYSEKQKKELAGKNVLLIDECIVSGDTIRIAYDMLSSFAGRGRVTMAVFSDDKGEGRYHSITAVDPSWRCYNYKSTEASDTAVSGVYETGSGFVKPDPELSPIANEVRTAFSKLGKIIAEYLKENMEIQ